MNWLWRIAGATIDYRKYEVMTLDKH